MTDVPDCPVFATGHILYDGSSRSTSSKNGDGVGSSSSTATVATVAALVTALALASLAGLVILVVKLRLVPRMRAWAANVPYDDMLVSTESCLEKKRNNTRTLCIAFKHFRRCNPKARAVTSRTTP